MTSSSLEARVAHIEGIVGLLDARLERLDARLDESVAQLRGEIGQLREERRSLAYARTRYPEGSYLGWQPAWFWSFFDTWTLKKQLFVTLVMNGPIVAAFLLG